MDPATIFCPNLACPARGQRGEGNIHIHARKDPPFLCTECHKTFSATNGTAFYRLRTAAETVSLVVTLMAPGCPLHAIVVAFGLDERTVAAWWARAGRQGQAVQAQVVEQPRDLGQVQAGEIRVKTQWGIVWMALAIMVKARLWLAGEVSEHRDRALIRRQIARVHACAQHRSLLFCTDDLCSYIWAIRGTFRDPVHTGVQRRPWLRPWRNVCISHVVKRSGHRWCADQYTLATRILGLLRRSPSGNLAGRDGQAGLPDGSSGASCLKQHHCENGGKCCGGPLLRSLPGLAGYALSKGPPAPCCAGKHIPSRRS
jgi:transposase-like protein